MLKGPKLYFRGVQLYAFSLVFYQVQGQNILEDMTLIYAEKLWRDANLTSLPAYTAKTTKVCLID